MLEAMKSLRDKMLSFHKASELGVVKTSDSAQAKPLPGTFSQPDPPTRILILLHRNTWMSNPWTWSLMDLHFLPSLLNLSPIMLPNTRMLNLITRNIVPIWSTTRRNINLNQAIFPSCRQRKMSPLPMSKSLQSLNTRFLQNLYLRTAQIQCFIGR